MGTRIMTTSSPAGGNQRTTSPPPPPLAACRAARRSTLAALRSGSAASIVGPPRPRPDWGCPCGGAPAAPRYGPNSEQIHFHNE
eukprot:1055339-Prorocentrum_minimum.AAC.1